MGEDRTFAAFIKLVKESLEEHAARKGYNKKSIDSENPLYESEVAIGSEPGHTIGEIRYKAAEYIEEPREVLPVKIAGWAYLLWRFTPQMKARKGGA